MKKIRKFLKNQSGTGLTEMMVALVVFVLLTMAAGGAFMSSQDSLNANYHTLTLQNELRKILTTMTQEIRESSASSPNPITISNNAISFEIPATVSGDTVTSWTQITYGLNTGDSTVTRTVGGQTTIVGNSISGLSFTYPADPVLLPRSVQIGITGTRNTLKRTITMAVTGQVTLRN
ncbi:MAG: hypothetical protein HY447_00845 [Candidatus Omnitrophica bacterium]|nr:hypothetical protein [Candidatus Omnitrophota bacterium]